MDLKLRDKIVVITGASEGIGYACAEAFLKEGSKTAMCARNEIRLNAAAETLRLFGDVFAETTDVTNESQVYSFADRVYDRFGRIDVWVNNVGATFARAGDLYTEQEIYAHYAVNFQSAVFGCQAAFRYMQKQETGVIVNIASLAARCGSSGRSTIYAPMKAAVRSLTQTLAGEYAAYGVRVNCVMPGFTATPLVKETVRQEELIYHASETLLRRVARPEEIAAPVVFLAGEGASYMTGTSIEVSGGRNVTLNPSYSWDRKEKLMSPVKADLYSTCR